MQINFILLFIFISSILLFACKKFKLLIDIKGERHKKFSSKERNYLIGGILILIYLILFYFKQNQILHIFFFVFIFLIGLFSDLKILNDPKKRFILQAIILYIFIHFLEIRILETRFIPLDHLLNNLYFNHVFVVFCLMILMNGSNFMDGLNTLLVTYNLFIFLILLTFFNSSVLEPLILENLILVLLVILSFNLFGKIILGDSGSYLLSIFTGFFLIQFAAQNSLISPFFIVLLLWYPCFELLFSISRRLISDREPYKPDRNHLHQILFKIFQKKIKNKNNLNHFFSSSLINIYNFCSIIIGAQHYSHSQTLILIIIINVLIYCYVYRFLKKKLS